MSPEFFVEGWVDLRRATSFSCWETNRAHQPLCRQFIEFSRILSGYKIFIRFLLLLYIAHTSFLMVETVLATAQQSPDKFYNIALK
jgi:hypothetical protein